MIKVNIHEAKTNLSSLLFKLEQGEDSIRICRNGIEIAELRSLPKKKKRNLKVPPRLKVKILSDPLEPLDPEDWGSLYHDFT